jgi:Hypothetical protein (DUF2513).
MKLNTDCIFDILCEIEKCTTYAYQFIYDPQEHDVYSRFKKYSSDEILYHIRHCESRGFFLNSSINPKHLVHILDLSFLGHKHLAEIRGESI